MGGSCTELFPGTTTDDEGSVDEAEKVASRDDMELLVVIGSIMAELLPVPTGVLLEAVLAGQNPLSHAVYCTVSLAAQL